MIKSSKHVWLSKWSRLDPYSSIVSQISADNHCRMSPHAASSQPIFVGKPCSLNISVSWNWDQSRLELHRQKETKATLHWPNTLLHWSQALKTRGFGEEELIDAVAGWRQEHGPFQSYGRRYPPTAKDISKAFATDVTPLKVSQRSNKSKGDWRTETKPMFGMNYEAAPHKSYICNRCGKGGT